MHHYDCKCVKQLHAEVAVGDAVNAVEGDSGKTEFFRLISAVGVVGGSRQCAAAYRRRGHHTAHGVADSVTVADKHHGVCQNMMSKGYGLCPLQMRIARHYVLFVLLREISDRLDKRLQQYDYIFAFITQIKPYIERDLIVTASCGVDFFTRIAYPPCKFGLYKHMYVLRVRIKAKPALFNILEYRGKPVYYPLRFVGRQYSPAAEHFGVNDRTCYILPVHAGIEVK